MYKQILFVRQSGGCVAMVDTEHRHKRETHKNRRIGEERGHTDVRQKRTGEDRGRDLCRHACRIVKAGVLADVAAFRHLHHHRVAVDVDRRPTDSGKREQGVHQPDIAARTQEGSRAESDPQKNNPGENGLFPSELLREDPNRNVGQDCRRLRDDHGEVEV